MTASPIERIGDDASRLRLDDRAQGELLEPEEWARWSAELGAELIPVLRSLDERLPGLRSAMICTGDGFNVCSTGVDVESVGQLAALASSLHSLAAASARTIVGERIDDADSVVATIGQTSFVVIGVPEATAGSLLLLVAADSTTLGALMMQAQLASERILTHVFTR